MNKASRSLSIVIPAYNEASNIQTTISEIEQAVKRIQNLDFYEFIVVDDHSLDNTFEKVQELSKDYIHCIRLSRRSGSHTAIRAGYSFCKSDLALFISADGQDDPNIIQKMISTIDSGNDIVWAARKVAEEKFIYSISRNIFYIAIKVLTRTPLTIEQLSHFDFFMLNQKALKALNSCTERNTSIFGLIQWLGFKQTFVEYERRERRHGKSKWTSARLFLISKDWLIAFSGLPLTFASVVGTLLASVSFIYGIFIFIYAILGHTSPGWAETILIILFTGGMQMIILGLIGEYLWKTLIESRKRPYYFIEKSNLE